MSQPPCPHEDAVGRAMRTGQWSAGLRDHVSQCRDCGEVAQVSGWLGRVAERLGRAEPPPDPSLAWLKAELAEQLRLEERARRPARLAWLFLHIVLWSALALATVWMSPILDLFLSGVGAWVRVPSLADLVSLGSGRPLAVLALLSVTAVCFYLQIGLRRALHR